MGRTVSPGRGIRPGTGPGRSPVHALQAAENAGTRALLVHALDEDAAAFNRHLGLVAPVFGALVLKSPLATARRSLGC